MFVIEATECVVSGRSSLHRHRSENRRELLRDEREQRARSWLDGWPSLMNGCAGIESKTNESEVKDDLVSEQLLINFRLANRSLFESLLVGAACRMVCSYRDGDYILPVAFR